MNKKIYVVITLSLSILGYCIIYSYVSTTDLLTSLSKDTYRLDITLYSNEVSTDDLNSRTTQ